MAETMAEILSPLFLPLVRQKYLSARQKTNTGTQYIIIPFVSHSLLSVIFRLTFFNGKHFLINDVSILKNVSIMDINNNPIIASDIVKFITWFEKWQNLFLEMPVTAPWSLAITA